MPDQYRPDRLGILFHFMHDEAHSSPFSKNCVIAYADSSDDDFWAQCAKNCYRMFWDVGTPVWLHTMAGKKILVDEEGQKITRSRYDNYLRKLKQF